MEIRYASSNKDAKDYDTAIVQDERLAARPEEKLSRMSREQ